MALEWVVLGYVAGAEAIMLVLLTLPELRWVLVGAVRRALKPMLSVVPFCLFLVMDIYWKYETRLSCGDHEHEHGGCSPADHLRHQKSIMRSQRNALLIAAAAAALFSVSSLALRLEQLHQRLQQLMNRDV